MGAPDFQCVAGQQALVTELEFMLLLLLECSQYLDRPRGGDDEHRSDLPLTVHPETGLQRSPIQLSQTWEPLMLHLDAATKRPGLGLSYNFTRKDCFDCLPQILFRDTRWISGIIDGARVSNGTALI